MSRIEATLAWLDEAVQRAEDELRSNRAFLERLTIETSEDGDFRSKALATR